MAVADDALSLGMLNYGYSGTNFAALSFGHGSACLKL